MKCLLILTALFALACAAPPPPQDGQIHIPDKCSDVLAVKVCNKLIDFAAKLKLKTTEVKNAVVEAYKKGKTKSEELYKTAKDILVNKVLTKKCEDFTTVEICDKLRKMAVDMKIQANNMKKYIIEQYAELKTKTCEDFFDNTQCTKLRDVAAKLKIKYEKLQDAIIEAYLDAKAKGTKKLTEVYNKIKTYVATTKCEDMFNPGLCAGFRKFAEKTKVAVPKMMEVAVDLVIKGAALGKSLAEKVYNIVDYYYDCTDIFDQPSCDRIKKFVIGAKKTAEEFEIAFRKYMRVAIEKGKSIYKTVKDFVMNKIYCKFSPSCVSSDDMEVDDALAMHKRSIFGDWKQKVRDLMDKYYPNLESSIKQQINKMIDQTKYFFYFMRQLAMKLLNEADTKMSSFIRDLMERLS